MSGHGGRCNNPGVLGGKGRINAGFPRIVAFLCNNPGGNGCFSGIIVVLSGHDGGRTRRPGYVRRGTVTTQEFETAGVRQCHTAYASLGHFMHKR